VWIPASVAVSIATLVVACGASDNVDSASCNACMGTSYTARDCQDWGALAGCKASTFVASVPGCVNGCSFTGCKIAPTCGEATLDAGRD
jgi:hypothetical protein